MGRQGLSQGFRWLAGPVTIAVSLLASSQALAAEPDFDSAWQFCKQDALMQLRVPETAKFDNISLQSLVPPSVSAYFSVDAEDSTGAFVRVWASCGVAPNDPNNGTVFFDSFKVLVLQYSTDPSFHHLPPE